MKTSYNQIINKMNYEVTVNKSALQKMLIIGMGIID